MMKKQRIRQKAKEATRQHKGPFYKKKCLSCDLPFMSVSNINRMCTACLRKQHFMLDYLLYE